MPEAEVHTRFTQDDDDDDAMAPLPNFSQPSSPSDHCFDLSTPRLPSRPKRILCERGKTTGGTSAINAMMWVRGAKEDFDRWARQGGANGAEVVDSNE